MKRGALLLLLASSATSLVGADLFLLWANPYQHMSPDDFVQVSRREVAAQLGRPFDSRDPRQFAKDEAAAGRITARGFFPWRYPLLVATATIAPLSSLSNSRTVLCNESGVWETFVSDEFGFDNPPGSFDEPSDLLLIGDSYLQGYCVAEDRRIPAILRGEGFSVINTGQAGNDPTLELATLREYGPRARAKIVLWFYFEKNDLPFGSKLGWSSPESLGSSILKKYVDDSEFSQRLIERQSEVDAAVRRAQAITEHERGHVDRTLPEWVHVARLIHLRTRIRGLWAGRRVNRQDLEPFDRILTRAQEVARGMGAKLYFVYLPAAESLLELAGPTSIIHRPGSALSGTRSPAQSPFQREEVIALVRERGVPIIDLLPEFEHHPDPASLFPFGGDGHYVAEGHRLVAETVARALRSQ